MKKLLIAGLMGIFLAMMVREGLGGGAQSMPGLQTSFPIQSSGLHLFPTPSVTPTGVSALQRPLKPTPTPIRGKFFPLVPKVTATPSRVQKIQIKSNNGGVTVIGPRQIHNRSIYKDSH